MFHRQTKWSKLYLQANNACKRQYQPLSRKRGNWSDGITVTSSNLRLTSDGSNGEEFFSDELFFDVDSNDISLLSSHFASERYSYLPVIKQGFKHISSLQATCIMTSKFRTNSWLKNCRIFVFSSKSPFILQERIAFAMRFCKFAKYIWISKTLYGNIMVSRMHS